jgi:hypothetical protein
MTNKWIEEKVSRINSNDKSNVKWNIENDLGKITIEASSKWEWTRNKNDRTVEKKIPEDEDDRSNTPNLLKERNFIIFD